MEGSVSSTSSNWGILDTQSVCGSDSGLGDNSSLSTSMLRSLVLLVI